jgi:hypothetical protein
MIFLYFYNSYKILLDQNVEIKIFYMFIEMDLQIIHTKNTFHLGDSIYSLIFLYNIHEYLQENNIYIHFYCENEHYSQIYDFNSLNNIKVFSIDSVPNDKKIYDLWIGSNEYNYNWYNAIVEPIISYDTFFCKYYNNILKTMNIPVIIEKYIYNDNELFKRCADINLRSDNYYNNIDFLINNAEPRSGQFDYNIFEFDNYIIELSKKYTIVTTQKVENIKCTRDYNLSAKDIASISLNIKNFIVIESGIIAGLYNEYLVDNADVTIYNLSKFDYHFCSFKNFNHKKNLNELRFLI